jgi:hypothetical protein
MADLISCITSDILERWLVRRWFVTVFDCMVLRVVMSVGMAVSVLYEVWVSRDEE